jgi:hypothetical protein
VVSAAVLMSVLATGLVSVRLHAEVMRLRYDIAGMERERDRVGGELRRAQTVLEHARSPRSLFRLRATSRGESVPASDVDVVDAGEGAETEAPLEATPPTAARPGAEDEVR